MLRSFKFLCGYQPKSKAKEEKVVKEFVSILNYLDNTHIKQLCGDIALNVIKNGAYYGYLIEGPKGASI